MVHRSRKVLFSLRRRSVRDAVTIAGLCLVTYIAAATFDVFGQTYEFIKRYEAYELDEAIVVAIVFGFLMAIYALRRVQDLKREIFKRRDAERNSANDALRLTTAVNNMSQGLLMFDSAERLVVCNERYHQMYNLSPEMAKPGLTLFQLIKHRAECGSFKGDPDQYYAQLCNAITIGQTTRQSIETPDGRTIHIVTHPMADGGLVATHEDMTDKLRAKVLIEKKELQLDAALENMSQGLCMFDATQHLTVCNKRYADLYGLNEQQTRPGTTLRAILQHRIAMGSAAGDQLSTNGKLSDYKLSYEYLTWPYPVEARHFRLKTLYQVQYIEVKTVFDAPILSATPDSSGNFTSYSTLGSKGYITPALGLGFHEYATRNFHLEANVSGFMLPHRWQLLDSDATIAYRAGHLELRAGAKGFIFRPSPKSDYFYRGTVGGVMVGLRWYSD